MSKSSDSREEERKHWKDLTMEERNLFRARSRALHKVMENEKKSRSIWNKVIPFLIGLSLFFVTIILFADGIRSDTRYIKKELVSSSILGALEHGADLRAVRNIYSNRALRKRGFRQLLDPMNEFYTDAVPLSQALEDIRSSLFVAKTPNDTLLTILNTILVEHTERNPFDALELIQKDYFENVRLKCGDSYPEIKTDVDKIAAELVSKNSLVGKYLSRSETSFWVSIIALLISIGFGVFQLYKSRNSKITRVFEEVMAELEKRGQEDDKITDA